MKKKKNKANIPSWILFIKEERAKVTEREYYDALEPLTETYPENELFDAVGFLFSSRKNIKRLIRHIEKLYKKNQWIPVEESLPEEYSPVRVLVDGKWEGVAQFDGNPETEDCKYYSWDFAKIHDFEERGCHYIWGGYAISKAHYEGRPVSKVTHWKKFNKGDYPK